METEGLTTADVLNALKPGNVIDRCFFRCMIPWLRLNKLNTIYGKIKNQPSPLFFPLALEKTGIDCLMHEDELNHIPPEGPFIIVANYPFGGIENLILLSQILSKRPDLKILGDAFLHKFDPLKEHVIAMAETSPVHLSNFMAFKEAIKHLEQGHPIAIFPARHASFHPAKKMVADHAWEEILLKMIRNVKVPVVPVFFDEPSPSKANFLSMIHPLLRVAITHHKLFRSEKMKIRIRIGFPISVKEQDEFTRLEEYEKFLRSRIYILGTDSLSCRRQFRRKKHPKAASAPEPVIDPVPRDLLEKEIQKITPACLLFESSNFHVFLAPPAEIPLTLKEIGRLREVTFREVGEGSNKSIDLDAYDNYYYHLFIWDTQARCVVGGYRIGKGKEILERYGREGFYVHSLFKLKKRFEPFLKEGLEMGRSFIVREYQRKPASLFLLWKGILYALLRNPEYRYMFGPVSISNDFSDFSKTLIVEFIRRHHYHNEIASYITPRTPFCPVKTTRVDKEFILETVGNDIGKLDEYIKNIENGRTIPVLIKKYLKLNAYITGFNVDPDFNNCLDGFVLADIFDFPADVVRAFSKEFHDNTILERFGYSL